MRKDKCILNAKLTLERRSLINGLLFIFGEEFQLGRYLHITVDSFLQHSKIRRMEIVTRESE
jgi:hypothetical protein